MTEREAELEQQVEQLAFQRSEAMRQRDAYSARIGRMNEEKKALREAMVKQIDRMEKALGRMRELLEFGP